jgi:hypothetical protein
MNEGRRFLFLALLAGLAIAGLGSPGRADFEVMFAYGGASITIDVTTQTATASGGASLSGATITYNSANMVTVSNLVIDPNGTTDSNSNGFSISASISKTNSPGTQNGASISTSGLDILNQTGASGSSTLVVTTGSTGFTAPTANLATLKSTASVSADGLNSSNASFVFNSYVNSDNSQFGTSSGFASPTISLSPVTPGGSASGNTSITGNATATPYSIVQVGRYTLANGDDFFDGSTGSSVVAPAPNSLLLALSGMPLLGVGAWLRRRRVTIAA